MGLKRKHSFNENLKEETGHKLSKKSSESCAAIKTEGKKLGTQKNKSLQKSTQIKRKDANKKFTDKKPNKKGPKDLNKIKELNENEETSEEKLGNTTETNASYWKTVKQEKKELQIKRKQQKPYYTVAAEMKKLYEILKRKSTKKEGKEQIAEKLFELLKDHIRSFVMAHDTARIVQCVLKKGNTEIRKKLSELLLPLAAEMATSKYAHHCVIRIIKYGDKTVRKQIIENLFGSICELTLNQISNSIIDIIYTTYADETQKSWMKQELFGELYKKSKDSTVTSLPDAYKNSPELKSAILNAVKKNLEQIANKNVIDNSLVHVVLYEYLTECQENDLENLISLYSTKIALLVTTRKGCEAATLLFWKAATKDRRVIVKSLKEHLLKISTHEFGHLFLIAISNCMDDTKAIKKQIFDPLAMNLDEIVQNQWGRRFILWLIAPACTDSFHPKLIEYFDEGLKYGKKPADVRRKEILEQIDEPLAKAICANVTLWMSNGQIGLVTAAILRKLSSSNFCQTAETVAKLVTQPDWMCEPNNEESEKNDSKDDTTDSGTHLGIEDSGLHVVLKKILKNDRLRISSNEERTFGEFVVENLTSEVIESWIKINRACFILLNALENARDETKEKLMSLIVVHKKTLKTQNHVGAKLLLKNLQE